MKKGSSGKRGRVFVDDIFAGIIEQSEGLYSFTYNEDYLNIPNVKPVSLTLPLQSKPFEHKTMIPFFDGLIPEGWLLEIISENWKIDRRDRMSLLLLACKDCIGCVSIVSENFNEETGNL
jgi:serine/threonine-protein kinase HipA